MTAKEETTLSEKNQNLLYEQQKERDCNTPFDFDRERCAKSMEELKEAFQKNPKILKRLMETEKYMEAMETKSEIMTLALASRIGSYDIPQLGKKYEKFFKISNKEKFRYIVDVFFHAQNT